VQTHLKAQPYLKDTFGYMYWILAPFIHIAYLLREFKSFLIVSTNNPDKEKEVPNIVIEYKPKLNKSIKKCSQFSDPAPSRWVNIFSKELSYSTDLNLVIEQVEIDEIMHTLRSTSEQKKIINEKREGKYSTTSTIDDLNQSQLNESKESRQEINDLKKLINAQVEENKKLMYAQIEENKKLMEAMIENKKSNETHAEEIKKLKDALAEENKKSNEAQAEENKKLMEAQIEENKKLKEILSEAIRQNFGSK
jgi:hypothetical protein